MSRIFTQMMAPLLPSEIDRLVYGQLERCNCQSIAEQFLKESPYMEECRDFVSKVGKPTFMKKAFGLSLQQILEQYLDMWNLILDKVNTAIPDTQEKFSDPVDALKFLLSVTNNNMNERGDNTPTLVDDTASKIFRNDEKPNSICLGQGTSPEVTMMTHTPLNSSELNATDIFDNEDDSVPLELNESAEEKNYSFPRLKKNCLLDELYASTENLENPNKKKKPKMLKPRQYPLVRDVEEYESNNPVAEICTDKDRIVDSENNCDKETNSHESDNSQLGTIKSMSLSTLKPTKMCLRSSNKVTFSRNSKRNNEDLSEPQRKRKRSKSFEQDGRLAKQTKLSECIGPGNETDTQIDYSKIPQLLIEDPKWSELIAENINKKISESPQKKNDSLVEDKDSLVQSVTQKTLEDELTDDFILGLLNCAQSLEQEKNSERNISLFDNPPYETDFIAENATISQTSNNINQVIIPESTNMNNQTYENTQYTKLHNDMNEFVRFSDTRTNKTISNPQSDILLIEMAATEQMSLRNPNGYVVENQTRAMSSNFVVCSTEEPSAQNGEDLQDEIISLCSNSNSVGWNIEQTPVVVTSAPAIINSNNSKCKLQVCGPVTSPNQLFNRRSYRTIAPKPVHEVLDNVTQMKTKSLRNLKKQ